MKKLQYILFLIIKFFVKIFYPKTEFYGVENLPDEPCIVVGNHSQMNGPIIGELYFPGERLIWCAGEMMDIKEVQPYAFKDFWSRKPDRVKWFYKILSYLIAIPSVCVFNSARTIPVYHNSRILTTFKQTIKGLKEGKNIIIFPEHDETYNNILCNFQEGFVDVAKTYYRTTKKEVSFVPMYIAPAFAKVYLGKPVKFDAGAPLEKERERICTYLKEEITDIARKLPRHRVVPYNNIPKKEYVYNDAYNREDEIIK